MNTPAKGDVYVTKWVLTQGILHFKDQGEITPDGTWILRSEHDIKYCITLSNWFSTPLEAQMRAYDLKANKIKALEKNIAKYRKYEAKIVESTLDDCLALAEA